MHDLIRYLTGIQLWKFYFLLNGANHGPCNNLACEQMRFFGREKLLTKVIPPNQVESVDHDACKQLANESVGLQ